MTHLVSGQLVPESLTTVRGIAPTCAVCGGGHELVRCPEVKALEYDSDGRLVKIVKR